MAKPNLGESRYLRTLGDELDPKIIIMWTGPDIISREITIQHIKELSQVLKRKPFIWDNVRHLFLTLLWIFGSWHDSSISPTTTIFAESISVLSRADLKS
jgi:hypothetical protein